MVVECERTGRFVQFATAQSGIARVLLDVPGRKENLPNCRRAVELLGEPSLGNVQVGVIYQKWFEQPADAAAAALAVLKECQGHVNTDTLVITRDVTGS